jgi:proteasome lid subunit RPN8/RPN11
MSKTEGKAPEPVSAGPWKETGRREFRTFPGPRGAVASLRVALSREAYADITAHSREGLDHEVCGVLAAVRGTAAREARGHVTFTQETWNSIHASLERDHPKLQIVGWYHTHPGFGVAFSDMDVFIQRNFFALPHQVALVMDPLGGDVALATNGAAGIEYMDRFWVDGREQRARVPVAKGVAGSGTPDQSLAALETRVSQLLASVQDLRVTVHRTLMGLVLGVALVVIALVGWAIRRSYEVAFKPPENIGFAPVAVNLEGKPAILGVAIVKWEIPEELLVLANARGGETVSPEARPSPEPSPQEKP